MTKKRTSSTDKSSNATQVKDVIRTIINRISENKKKVAIVVVVLVVVWGVIRVGGKSGKTDVVKEQISEAKAVQELNKELLFPLRGPDGKEVNKIAFVIEKAELRDEIVVQGQKATAISGRTFLVTTVKIKNEHSQAIEIDTRDYMRLSVGGSEDEWLAPNIHNDPVEVQAISTKYTRLGFSIDEDERNLKLRVGEIGGDKETVDLQF